MRIFVALEVSDEMKIALTAFQENLRGVQADVRWVQAENIHLTLNFLGEIEERQIAEIADICKETSSGCRPFTLRLNGSGVFPNPRQPRILWAGVGGEIEILTGLQKKLEERFTTIRAEGDEKAYHPHITLGRLMSNRNAHELVARADLYNLPAAPFEAREIVVMQSEFPAKVRYTVLDRAFLNPPAS